MRQSVFKTHQQVLELKGLFFEGSFEEKRRALALCRAYETRQPLPTSVHLTALLTAALQADVPMNDVYAIQLGYSAALIRMVNEILDSAQTGKIAAPLHALAKMLDLPNTFVEARHAATHENIPSIYVLRELSNRALGWLYDKFWVLQVPQKRKALDTDTKQTLISWRRSRRAHVNGPLCVGEKEIVESLQLQFETDHGLFFGVIFEKNIIFPTELSSEIEKKIEKATVLYGPAFAAMGRDFLEQLCVELCARLNNTEYDAINTDLAPRTLALVTWLEYAIEQLDSPSSLVLENLGSRPRPWNAKGLAAYYRHFQDHSILEKARKMARFTRIDVNLPEPQSQVASKWKTVDRWAPRAIGT